jgi:hypothetical protein
MSITTLSSVAVGTTGTAALSMGHSSRIIIPKLGMLMNGVQLNGISGMKAALVKVISTISWGGGGAASSSSNRNPAPNSWASAGLTANMGT